VLERLPNYLSKLQNSSLFSQNSESLVSSHYLSSGFKAVEERNLGPVVIFDGHPDYCQTIRGFNMSLQLPPCPSAPPRIRSDEQRQFSLTRTFARKRTTSAWACHSNANMLERKCKQIRLTLCSLSLLGNGSVNKFPRQRIYATLQELLDGTLSMRSVSYQWRVCVFV
jgi:hypothetical protein